MSQNDKSSNSFPWKEILTFLGIVIAAYIGYLGIRYQTEYPISVTQTAEAKLTIVVQNQIEILETPTLPLILTPTIDTQLTITDTPSSNFPNPNKSFFAVLVGVTEQTEFSLSDAASYTYMANASNVDEAIIELSKVFTENDLIYVVHVPNLRVTLGNPGSCKLYLQDVKMLEQYTLGWIIGGNNIVPDQFESNLEFCFAPSSSETNLSSKLYVFGYSSTDLAVIQAVAGCNNCEVVYLSSLNDLSDDWKHHTFNLASPTVNLSDGCRTKQELINLEVSLMIANNFTPCK